MYHLEDRDFHRISSFNSFSIELVEAVTKKSVNDDRSVADPGGGRAREPCPPPSMDCIIVKKDGRRWPPHTFHISISPYHSLDPLPQIIKSSTFERKLKSC